MRQIDHEFYNLRLWSTVAIRLIAIYLAVSYGLAHIGSYLGTLVEPWMSYADYPIDWMIVNLLAMGVLAGAIWFLAPWVSRKLIADYVNKCPKCRFDLEYFRADRCPECGLFLGEDFHAPPPPTQAESPSE